MAQDTEENQSIADILGGLATKMKGKPTVKEAPFENYTMYSAKDIYLGNYSLPENFSEATKETVMTFFANKGIKLLKPGSTRKDISMDELE